MKQVEVFTDGACRGNPGAGGWGVILRYNGVEKEMSGAENLTTNNKMELTAVIKALQSLKEPCSVLLSTDSQYVMKGFTEWLPSWIKNAWKTSEKKAVANKELWQSLLQESERHQIKWQWIKGHNGHPENERCDALARNAIDNLITENKA